MAKERMPRTSRYMMSNDAPDMGANGTWIEAESMCYPAGTMLRYAKCRVAGTQKYTVVRCGLPWCFSSITAASGNVTMDESTGEYLYTPLTDAARRRFGLSPLPPQED